MKGATEPIHAADIRQLGGVVCVYADRDVRRPKDTPIWKRSLAEMPVMPVVSPS
jgi:hypothetical protein